MTSLGISHPPRLSICSLVTAQHSLSCVFESECDAHDRMTMKRLWSSALPYWRHRQTINIYHAETVQVYCIQIPVMIFRLCSSYSLAARGALSRQFHGNTIIRESVKDKVREMGQKVRYYSCCCTTSWHFTRSISKWVKAWLQLSTKEKRQPTQQKRN